MRGFWSWKWLCLAATVGFVSVASAQPSVKGVRLGLNGNSTRFVLDISEKPGYRVFLLSNPHRVVIDLPTVTWEIPRDIGGRGKGLIVGFRFGQFRPDTSRVVLDLKGPAAVKKLFVLPAKAGYPFRLVLDLAPVSAAAYAKELAKWRPPKPKKAIRGIVPGIKPKVSSGPTVIVIDAGHGGVDPGTIGASGIPEKVITLAAARELKGMLEKAGNYRVVLTRNRDIFLELRERVAVARRNNARLFISLHADSIRNKKVRGATIYTLSERASDKEAEGLAIKENKADIIAGVDLVGESDEVTGILIDLAQRETMNYAARFAQALVPELGGRRRIRSRPHRFAGFRVLKAPDVPSVLFEMGYLSNKRDERILATRAGRAEMLEAVVRAVKRYFSGIKA